MNKIKIFIAGSKDLIQERNYIKILANDLNSIYNARDFMIIIHSYEHFNDRQDEYNRFIEEEADIVLFILDGEIGGKTEEEFLKASGSYNRNNRPEVMVFLHDFKELTSDIARIQGLLLGRLGDKYYINYSNLDELKSKARERIIRYIENKTNNMSPSKTPVKSVSQKTSNDINSLSKKTKTLIYSMSCAIIILAGALCWSLFRSSDLLIFAGGGSVKNYIEITKGLDLVDYPHSIYANLASGTAWALLPEEANRYQEDKGRGQDHFSSICLSADDIDSAMFINEKTRGMFDKSRIIRYNIGKDPLVLYVHKDIISERNLPSESSIHVDSMRSLVKYALSIPDKIRVFTTSKTSGTLRLYQSCFKSNDSVDLEELFDEKKTYLFYKNSSSAYINALDSVNGNRPYVILGSQYYYPQTLDTEKEINYRALYVKNGNDTIFKPMNLYFIGRYSDAEDYCTIKKSVVQFLKDIHAEENIDHETWNDLLKGKKKTEGGNLILKLN